MYTTSKLWIDTFNDQLVKLETEKRQQKQALVATAGKKDGAKHPSGTTTITTAIIITTAPPPPPSAKDGGDREVDYEGAEHQRRRPLQLRALEFYSGLGGWAYSLRQAKAMLGGQADGEGGGGEGDGCRYRGEVVAAWDISTVANRVYHHNHHRTPSPSSIDNLDSRALDRWQADLWMLSPPCQPHTRNNTTDRRDVNDPRSSSFLSLTTALAGMESPPTFIILENVKSSPLLINQTRSCPLAYHEWDGQGFEESESCRRWLACLGSRGYQIGCPNDRPRYFCLARRLETATSPPSNVVTQPPWRAGEEEGEAACKTLESYLEGHGEQEWDRWRVPDTVLDKNAAWCFDIVTPHSDRSACFTKSYTRYIRGTGSVLYYYCNTASPQEQGQDPPILPALTPPERREFNEEWREQLKLRTIGRLRFFTPREVANLLHFPPDFTFPPDTPLRKQYELLGNSIHVGLASQLLAWLLAPAASSLA